MMRRMRVVLSVLWLSTAVGATAPSPHQLVAQVRALKNDLARYRYLVSVLPKPVAGDPQLATQLLAATENELGLYDMAVRRFPFDNRQLPAIDSLPRPDQMHASNAADAIASLVGTRRIVMINEAHHDAHTRELTLALLPRLRRMGFTHLAMEALNERDVDLARRGYPLSSSGSEYLHEPLLGEIVRQALRLGFVVVPYESASDDNVAREAEQASQLYRRTLAGKPDTRLLVHAGYAHIDKASGRLGPIEPLAMQLKRLSGIEPFSIDQIQFRWIGHDDGPDAYRWLVDTYAITRPSVLLNAQGLAWSSDPARYDVSVILPPSGRWGRPRWLALDGQRHAQVIDASLCRHILPCVVDALYLGEPDDAIPADRQTFLEDQRQATLYLQPGAYRLRAWDAQGRTLGRRELRQPPP